jgi:choline kinase|tara:strand:+ start:193 stop:912 length:720 start_codon:yes stop_codon:yes gene_type:complete
MKAIILCAGLGSRLNSKKPKGFIVINNKTLLERCVKNLISVGFKKKDIFFATGFKKNLVSEKFGKKFNYSFNKYYKVTNMVYTLFNTLKDINNSSVLVTYSDIIYDKENIKRLLNKKSDISTLVDFKWKKIWLKKKKLLSDSESLKIKKNKIIELGKPTKNIKKIDGRYVGVLKISKDILPNIYDLYQVSLKKNPKKFKKIDMTNFLNFLIKKKYELNFVKLSGSWNEYDDFVDLNYKF